MVRVNVISKRGLTEMLARAPDAVQDVMRWYKAARKAEWRNLIEIRRQFPSADQIGRLFVFNMRHNRYRLIVKADLATQRMFVKALLTHKEYEREEWKKWA